MRAHVWAVQYETPSGWETFARGRAFTSHGAERAMRRAEKRFIKEQSCPSTSS